MDLVYRAYPLYHGNWNDVVHCQQIPDVDLRFWQEVSSHANKATDSSTDNKAENMKTPNMKGSEQSSRRSGVFQDIS